MWDHSFLTRDQTLTPSIGMHRVLTPGLQRKNNLLSMLLFSNLDIFKKIILKFYLFLAVLGLHCCVDFSLVAVSRG